MKRYLSRNNGKPHGAKRASNRKPSAEFGPSDLPWERPVSTRRLCLVRKKDAFNIHHKKEISDGLKKSAECGAHVFQNERRCRDYCIDLRKRETFCLQIHFASAKKIIKTRDFTTGWNIRQGKDVRIDENSFQWTIAISWESERKNETGRFFSENSHFLIFFITFHRLFTRSWSNFWSRTGKFLPFVSIGKKKQFMAAKTWRRRRSRVEGESGHQKSFLTRQQHHGRVHSQGSRNGIGDENLRDKPEKIWSKKISFKSFEILGKNLNRNIFLHPKVKKNFFSWKIFSSGHARRYHGTNASEWAADAQAHRSECSGVDLQKEKNLQIKINQSINRSINQTRNQPINRSIEQSINQPLVMGYHLRESYLGGMDVDGISNGRHEHPRTEDKNGKNKSCRAHIHQHHKSGAGHEVQDEGPLSADCIHQDDINKERCNGRKMMQKWLLHVRNSTWLHWKEERGRKRKQWNRTAKFPQCADDQRDIVVGGQLPAATLLHRLRHMLIDNRS